MPLGALLWDVDGTLVDSEDLHRQAFNQAFAQAGLGLRWDRREYGRLLAVAGGLERIRHALASRPDLCARAAGLDLAALHRRKTEIFGALLAGAGVLRPGVARLLREAGEAGLRQAIVTTTSAANVAILLETHLHDVGARFAAIVSGEDVAAKKPAPHAHLLALARLGLDARDCLALEDSENGLAAARAAGLPTLVTWNAYTKDDDFCGALVVLDHLGEPDQPCSRRCGPRLSGPCVTDRKSVV
jgi:HAD superfamily hydrolase (TIGR01509 family)